VLGHQCSSLTQQIDGDIDRAAAINQWEVPSSSHDSRFKACKIEAAGHSRCRGYSRSSGTYYKLTMISILQRAQHTSCLSLTDVQFLGCMCACCYCRGCTICSLVRYKELICDTVATVVGKNVLLGQQHSQCATYHLTDH
jgi:hypothetical protein